MTLIELAQRVEAAGGADRELDKYIHCFRFPHITMLDFECGRMVAPAYTASIDAALTLVPEGWRLLGMGEYGSGMGDMTGRCYAIIAPRDLSHLPYTYEAHASAMRKADAATAALALCAAALRARQEKNDG